MVVVRSILYAIVFYLVTGLMLVAGIWLLAAPRRWAMQGLRLHGLVCTWLLRVICGTRLEVRGRDNLPAGACLVVAKHQSAWDTFALVPLLHDPAIVLKDELKWIPVYGWFCVKFEHILVKRERAAVALKRMLGDAKSRAEAGRQVLIFPEGTRQPPGNVPDYKPGFVALYESLGVPCVPLALNSGLYWPRRDFRRYPGTIVVEILAPMTPGLPRAAFKTRVVETIEAACDRLLAEAANSPAPPPLGPEARLRLEQIKERT